MAGCSIVQMTIYLHWDLDNLSLCLVSWVQPDLNGESLRFIIFEAFMAA